MVRLFGFALGGRAVTGNNDRPVDDVDRASGSRSSAQRNSLSEKNTPGNSSSGNGKMGKRRRRFEEERKKEEQKGARRKSSFEHRGSLTSSVPQGSIWDYGDPALPPGMLPKKATATASNSGGGRAECPRLSVNIRGARNRTTKRPRSEGQGSTGDAEYGANSGMSLKKEGRKSPSRFSLRRFFYGNPLFAQPFLPVSPIATPLSKSLSGGHRSVRQGYRSRHRRHLTGGSSSNSAAVADDSVSEKSSMMWRDNLSSCSSIQQHHGGAGSLAGSNAAGGAGHGLGAGTTVVGPDGKVIRECSLCLHSPAVEHFPLLRNCPHLSCIDCLQVYVKIELQEGRVNIKCPQCPETLHPNDIEMLIGDNNNLLKLYEFLMLRRILASDPDTRWCPGPNCTYAVIAAGCASCPRITCERPGCGYSFCYHCKAEWHPNQTCDMARSQRQPHFGMATFRSSSASFSQESGGHASEVKVCPRCHVLIVKMDDGSCNHMTCSVCGSEFCWLCMKEISDLHYLSPSGCTFWGKKPWSRKKKLICQLGTLVGAPVGIALLAGIAVPAMIIGIPVWVGRKLHAHYRLANKHKRNTAITAGVTSSILVSPIIAGLVVTIGVPILLAYVYGVVPISLCRSEGCGVSTSGNGGVKIDVNEDDDVPPYHRPTAAHGDAPSSHVTNPSIGEVSLGASLSMGSACHLDERGHGGGGCGGGDGSSAVLTGVGGTRASSAAPSGSQRGSAAAIVGAECDRESASNTAIAGSVASAPFANGTSTSNSGIGGGASRHVGGGGGGRCLEVGADVHSSRSKKFSLSSETVSMSIGDNASTKALAGSILAYRFGGVGDNQSVSSYRTDILPPSGDEISLRSLPAAVHQQQSLANHNQHQQHHQPHPTQRSMSPVSAVIGGEEPQKGRRSSRRRPHLEKQVSENSSLLSGIVGGGCGVDGSDAVSERVRFDDNVSFIDEVQSTVVVVNKNPAGAADDGGVAGTGAVGGGGDAATKLHKPNVIDTSIPLPEETPEELAMVVSPSGRKPPPPAASSGDNVTLVSIDGSSHRIED